MPLVLAWVRVTWDRLAALELPVNADDLQKVVVLERQLVGYLLDLVPGQIFRLLPCVASLSVSLPAMDWFVAALVGVAGGASMEAIDVIKSIKWHHQMPWNVQPESIDPPQRNVAIRPGEESLPAPGWKSYGVTTVLRLFISGCLTGVLAATFILSPLLAFMSGLGALAAVERVATLVPLAVKNIGQAAFGSVAQEPNQQVQRSYMQQPAAADRPVQVVQHQTQATGNVAPNDEQQPTDTGGVA